MPWCRIKYAYLDSTLNYGFNQLPSKWNSITVRNVISIHAWDINQTQKKIELNLCCGDASESKIEDRNVLWSNLAWIHLFKEFIFESRRGRHIVQTGGYLFSKSFLYASTYSSKYSCFLVKLLLREWLPREVDQKPLINS